MKASILNGATHRFTVQKLYLLIGDHKDVYPTC
jgi:hypothetical protein